MIDQDDLRYQFSRSGQTSNFIIGNDTTELELSVESRSFVNRVNDQVRKRKEFATLQEKEKNILLFGECLWL